MVTFKNKLFDAVITVVVSADIEVWKITQIQIPKFIKSRKYIAYVPEDSLEFIRESSSEVWIIKSEQELVEKRILAQIIEKFESSWYAGTKGWYIQQFVKLLYPYLNPDENIFIIDSDTIPVRKIRLSNSPMLYTSREYHKPYFESMKKITGMEKTIPRSFISQGMMVPRGLLVELVELIEQRCATNFLDAILNNIPNEHGWFSEYETMGTFMYLNHNVRLKKSLLLRNGASLIGITLLKFSMVRFFLGFFFRFISIEKWDEKKA